MVLFEFSSKGKITKVETILSDLLGYDKDFLIGKDCKLICSDKGFQSDIKIKGIHEGEFTFLNKKEGSVKLSGAISVVTLSDEDRYSFNVRQSQLKEEINEYLDLNEDINVLPFHEELHHLQAENTERLKELAAINQTTNILKEGKPIEETLQQIVSFLPKAWQYPEDSVARIIYNGTTYKSKGFVETEWKQSQKFETIDNRVGLIEVCYTKKHKDRDDGPFLKEERHLINNLSTLISGYINSSKAKEILGKSKIETLSQPEEKSENSTTGRQLLHKFLNKHNSDRDIYHDLMPFKVKEILLVATLYDAFSIEKEGRFTEHMLGEYYQLNLTSLPRITGVSTQEDALELIKSKHFDLVIIMMGVDKNTPLILSDKIKEDFSYIPVFLLLNNNSDIKIFEEKPRLSLNFDKIFVWNGDSKIFFAMVKLIEDKINVPNDSETGMIRVILLVEDSAKYYSRYLPMLYNIVLSQTKNLIEDVSSDELYKVLKLRARPKILLASDYEEAVDIFNKYKEHMLCLISDMKFWKEGVLDENAGVDLVKYVRSEIKDLPIVIQSSDIENTKKAHSLNTSFIYKNSETLGQDFKSFIIYYLGFGQFVFRDAKGRQINTASTMHEFEQILRTIPEESLIYHSTKNHFSLWLMARGEIEVSKIVNPLKVNDFKSVDDLRNSILDMISNHLHDKKRGKIVPFEEAAIIDDTNIVSLASGALGGKGRGLSFINTLINDFDFTPLIKNINIKTPKTLIIGTDEFELFIERNNLQDEIYHQLDYEEIKRLFIEANLTEGLIRRLKKMLNLIKTPLAVRSSGLFEDSLMQPFAGIFETYLIPNNHTDNDVRLYQLVSSIKLVYASVFSALSRGYIEAVNYRIEEEKMAVVIQEVVGNQFDDYYYPHISGVAQSYNYYPYAHMKPDEGFVVAAVGLGKYVVEGEKAYRFSPKYPGVEINSPKDQYKNSQTDFFAINLKKQEINLMEGEMAGLIKLDIWDAEKHGTLKHCVSVYNPDNEVIVPGLDANGPRIVNFANILKYNYIPLAETIEMLLNLIKDALGSPVEIEFAIDLNKDADNKASFYLLQIKPLIGNSDNFNIDMDSIDKDKIVLYAEKGMGNGIIEGIHDIVYIDIDAFNKLETMEMADEIAKLNEEFGKQNKKYVLVGPGRWGTRDKFIGIPVTWPQISNAKIIVEMSLEDFPLDASLGSHFFHNVISMNVGYLSIQHEKSGSFISWDTLNKQTLIKRTKYFKHVCFEKDLTIRMDGKQRLSVITFDDK